MMTNVEVAQRSAFYSRAHECLVNGNAFFPASKAYTSRALLSGAVPGSVQVNCDMCGAKNIPWTLNYLSYDLCARCVDTTSTSAQQKTWNKELLLGLHLSKANEEAMAVGRTLRVIGTYDSAGNYIGHVVTADYVPSRIDVITNANSIVVGFHHDRSTSSFTSTPADTFRFSVMD